MKTSAFTLRPYQQQAAIEAVQFFKDPYQRYNAIEVLPTGSGKSLIIASVATELDAPTVVFQPSLEILEQNYAKFQAYGFTPAIYSASAGSKQVGHITLATIGTAIRDPSIFHKCRHIIIDEAHLVNPKSGMYSTFLQAIPNAKTLGLTATPFRLASTGMGSMLKFLTRTRPRVFSKLIYYVQTGDLFEQGFLAPMKYYSPHPFDRSKLKLNSTGADFDDASLRRYYNQTGFPNALLDMVRRAAGARKNVLVFTRFIEESQNLVNHLDGTAAIVTGSTPKAQRRKLIADFKSGIIKVICNVGVLTTGFDYPELETIIVARPTRSLALWYQMAGRASRPHVQKPNAVIVDMCGNLALFGTMQDMKIINTGGEKWALASRSRLLTNVFFDEPFSKPK
jgi:DNA repair protein RadD